MRRIIRTFSLRIIRTRVCLVVVSWLILNDGCLLYDFQNTPPFHLAVVAWLRCEPCHQEFGPIRFRHERARSSFDEFPFVKRMRNLVFTDDFHGLVAFGPGRIQ